MYYYIVRDSQSPGDVATVWNYKLREWAWDIDGYYEQDDGFAYTNLQSAKIRARILDFNEKHKAFDSGREPFRNIRVVTRSELLRLRDLD
jgi:hypothetical protein